MKNCNESELCQTTMFKATSLPLLYLEGTLFHNLLSFGFEETEGWEWLVMMMKRLEILLIKTSWHVNEPMPSLVPAQKAYLVLMSSSRFESSLGVLSRSSAMERCLAESTMLNCSHKSPSITFWNKIDK